MLSKSIRARVRFLARIAILASLVSAVATVSSLRGYTDLTIMIIHSLTIIIKLIAALTLTVNQRIIMAGRFDEVLKALAIPASLLSLSMMIDVYLLFLIGGLLLVTALVTVSLALLVVIMGIKWSTNLRVHPRAR